MDTQRVRARGHPRCSVGSHRLPRLGGWQRKADAVSVYRGKAFSLPDSTNAPHPGKSPGGRDGHPVPISLQLQLPLVCPSSCLKLELRASTAFGSMQPVGVVTCRRKSRRQGASMPHLADCKSQCCCCIHVTSQGGRAFPHLMLFIPGKW